MKDKCEDCRVKIPEAARFCPRCEAENEYLREAFFGGAVFGTRHVHATKGSSFTQGRVEASEDYSAYSLHRWGVHISEPKGRRR